MRTIIFFFFLIPITGLAQRADVFIKLTDARNQSIKGEAVMKGFERAIQATTFNNAGVKNNTQVSFTMAVSGASADLKRAMLAGEFLLKGEVTVLAPPADGAPTISYTIKMENISVLSCTEIMSCNNLMNTTVSLQATRIGWTYYTQNPRGGASAVSKKFGWDSDTKSDWANF